MSATLPADRLHVFHVSDRYLDVLVDLYLFEYKEPSRKVPYYTSDMIQALSVKDRLHTSMSVSTQTCYILALRALCPPGIAVIPWLALALTPRDIVLAALLAINVIDGDGYIRKIATE